jgi:hypothetical protein
MIPCSNRRCTHVEDGARCITRLSRFNPGPDCFRHQAELVRLPPRAVQEEMALSYLDRLIRAHPTPAGERAVAA